MKKCRPDQVRAAFFAKEGSFGSAHRASDQAAFLGAFGALTALTAAFFQIPGVFLVSGALLAGFILTLLYAGKGETA